MFSSLERPLEYLTSHLERVALAEFIVASMKLRQIDMVILICGITVPPQGSTVYFR